MPFSPALCSFMSTSKSSADDSGSDELDRLFAVTKFYSSKHLAIIAMKGRPFTRKTEFATIIAAHYQCPLLSLEHFLDVVEPAPSSPHRPQDVAFRIICGMAGYHLSYGVSNKAVIDSPLSCASHLHQLTELALSLSPNPARIVIIECKPTNKFLWQMKFEEHIAMNPGWASKWYRPKTWEDMEEEIKANYDYDECHGLTFGQTVRILVRKLVLDPVLDEPVDNLLDECHKSYKVARTAPRLAEAIDHMITRRAWHGPRVVVYHEWQLSKDLSSSSRKLDGGGVGSLGTEFCSRHGHNICNSGIEYEEEASCMACQSQVSGTDDAYTCKNCSLALHKTCAESFDKCNTWGSPFPKSHFSDSFHFPKEFACKSCEEDGKVLIDNCASCLFETHLKCRLMPTVINHFDTEEHFLTIVLPPTLKTEVHRCIVCGGSDRFNLYLCKTCGVAYHYECVTLPRRMEHEHGGHDHHLSLKFSSPKAEDYICDECLEWRDPGLWFYSCEECAYQVHLSCVHPT